ncbi:choice-of-anchor A domain-containing protein/LPXTG-motif cell wall-anchored protein [Microbacterium sp. BE35]|uniref:choice-of-anchor A family protein n=1 Tax=Microbacterium sp. BE35 TaxID=2817773 RepID=UPI00285573B0|nr:choice-of-anchor A family protein [Microbacterium sp. BE35]MDR7188673.1 choice-of-anchor A domain-containing protein/LPXTG-motif cell wall-anchored protein [Microbacterium sp. BE35]
MSGTRRRSLLRTALIAALGVAVAATLTGWSVLGVADPATAELGECPPGTIPGPGNSNPIWTDDNVAVYAGQDFRAEAGAAEVEGLVIVQGDADFTKSPGGTFNVGWVGVGSGVVPTPGEVMLAVGGDLSVGAGTVLDVGANARDASDELLGGNVDVGGITTPDYETDGSRYRLNNGALQQELGAAATAPWSTWGADITAASTTYAALPSTGTVTAAFTRIDFVGDGAATQQVFTVASGDLAANPEIHFTGIPDGATVVINVTGSGPVTWAPYYFGDGADRVDDPASPDFGTVAQRTLWNFVAASSVHVAGSSQVLGSILVPAADPAADQPALRVTASTNGRLYTNGTIVMDGAGNEHHNYPWIDPPFDCIPEPIIPPATGSVTIAKDISPEDAAVLPEGVLFHGTVVCELPEDGGEVVAEWYVAPGESVVVDGLPVGASCVIQESIGVGSRAVAPLVLVGAVLAPTYFLWQTPAWDPSPPQFVVPASDDPVQFTFTVTNALVRGAFTIEKSVEGEGAPDAAFTGTWLCTLAGATVGDGEWSLQAGQATEPIEALVGAVCAVTETTPAEPDGGSWSAPVIDPPSVTITAASALEPLTFVVTNTFVPEPVLGGFDIVKAVDDPDGVGFADSFGGTWSCTAEGSEVAGGSWTATTTEPFAVDDIAVGATCSVTEDAPADPADGTWGDVEIEPASFVVEDAETRVTVTVTNTLAADAPAAGGGELPATGTTVPWWAIAVGGGLLIGGAVVVLITVVRRRRS